MNVYDNETKNIISGEWEIRVGGNECLSLKRPAFEEMHNAEREGVKEYYKCLNEGLKRFSEIEKDLIEECEKKNAKYELVKDKSIIFKELIESKEYNDLKIEEEHIAEDKYNERFLKMLKKYVKTETIEELKKAESIFIKYYKRSAEYFANMKKLKALLAKSVYKGSNLYFKKEEDISKESDERLSILLRKTDELILRGRRKEFFFTLF